MIVERDLRMRGHDRFDASPADARTTTPAHAPAARPADAGRSDAGPADTRPAAPTIAIVPFSYATTSMGGRLVLHLDAADRGEVEARRATAATVRRIERWASRLTRHSDLSELSALNADPHDEVAIGPTLAAALRAGRRATEETEGLADITLLGARLAAEGLAVDGLAADELEAEGGFTSHAFDWSIAPGRRGAATVRRAPGLRFDLDGIGKGWIADRTLHLLADWPSAVIDADGDLAIRCAADRMWEVSIDDPRSPDASLATLRLAAPANMPARWGVATSGTSIHRWTVAGQTRHHLIDPRTGRPAVTDVVQATVIAGTALRAESLAKAAVIAGSVEGFALLERARIRGAVVLTERGETLALPQTLSLLGN
jgi:FAD:protein FMN transferase